MEDPDREGRTERHTIQLSNQTTFRPILEPRMTCTKHCTRVLWDLNTDHIVQLLLDMRSYTYQHSICIVWKPLSDSGPAPIDEHVVDDKVHSHDVDVWIRDVNCYYMTCLAYIVKMIEFISTAVSRVCVYEFSLGHSRFCHCRWTAVARWHLSHWYRLGKWCYRKAKFFERNDWEAGDGGKLHRNTQLCIDDMLFDPIMYVVRNAWRSQGPADTKLTSLQERFGLASNIARCKV